MLLTPSRTGRPRRVWYRERYRIWVGVSRPLPRPQSWFGPSRRSGVPSPALRAKSARSLHSAVPPPTRDGSQQPLGFRSARYIARVATRQCEVRRRKRRGIVLIIWLCRTVANRSRTLTCAPELIRRDIYMVFLVPIELRLSTASSFPRSGQMQDLRYATVALARRLTRCTLDREQHPGFERGAVTKTTAATDRQPPQTSA